MTHYALYLESGPRQRMTMVHVLDLLGCIARGATTEAALDATPEAIRLYRRFLHRHGEAVKLASAFTTEVAAHVTEGTWLGYGDPTPGFAPDLEPLTAKDLKVYRQRLEWLWVDLMRLIQDVPVKQLVAEPSTGRSIYHILDHVADSQCVYLRYLVGKVDGLPEAKRAMQSSPEMLQPALTRLWEIADARLTVLTVAERRQLVQHGQVTWTARRAVRRMLEHAWEHLLELSNRFDRKVGK